MEILGGQKEHVTGLPLPFPSILPQRAVVANANEPNKPHKKMLSCFNSLKKYLPGLLSNQLCDKSFNYSYGNFD